MDTTEHDLTDFERVLGTVSTLGGGVTIRLQGPHTPRPTAPDGGEPAYVAVVHVDGTPAMMGFGEHPLEAVENACTGAVLAGPYKATKVTQ